MLCVQDVWQDRINEGSRQCQFTEVSSPSLGNLDVTYDPVWDCCMYYKKGFKSSTDMTREL